MEGHSENKSINTPFRDSLPYPVAMNFELTTKCPLRCPQCYCYLEGGRDLDFGRACEVLRDGAENGLQDVALSGGETMMYPRIFDLISECKRVGVLSNVALSGFGLDEKKLARLIDAGVGRIFISLNGSTNEINSITRDGYYYAVNALELLRKAQFPETVVNYVVHNSNCGDFMNMVKLCEKYHIKQLVVMAVKPTSKHELSTLPDKAQTLRLAEDIETARAGSSVNISVEHCYSPLRAFLRRSFLCVSTNRGINRGCSAGRATISLSVEGNFTPCRHLMIDEYFKTIGEYWSNSEVLSRLRDIEDSAGEPCLSCEYGKYCLSCPAVNYKLNNQLKKQNNHCFFAEYAE